MQVTATQAKNRFGALCSLAKTGPVFVAKDGCIDTVLVSAQQFAALQLAAQGQTSTQRQAEFDRTHCAWLAEQNSRFEANGLWCDELRVW